jgi:hypothetical protein
MLLLYKRMEGTLDFQYSNYLESLADSDVRVKQQLLMQVRSIAREMFVGLHHLHCRNMCHGDIHIQNVLCCGLTEVVVSDLESVHRIPVTSAWEKMYDIVAVGHVMARLITKRLKMEVYPGSDEAKENLKRSLRENKSPLQCYDSLCSEALEFCSGVTESLSPTTFEFLESVLQLSRSTSDRITSAEQGWRVLTNSPSFHGPVSGQTQLDETGSGNAIYLDRHRVYPDDFGSALVHFQLIRGGTPDKIAFAYTRNRICSSHENIINKEHYSSSRELCNVTASTFDLCGMSVRVDDRPGHFLKGFQLMRPTQSFIKFRFWSIQAPPAAARDVTVRERNTEWNEAAGGSIYYLDRHCIRHEENTCLKGFVIEKREKPGSEGLYQIRFKYWIQNLK